MPQRLKVVTPQSTPPVWAALRNEAAHAAQTEPGLASLLHATILKHEDLAAALSYQLARKLGDQELRAMSVREHAEDAFASDPGLMGVIEADLQAVFERDPACKGYLQPFLFFKGFQALQTHRVAHWLYHQGRETLAFYLQSRMSEVFQVDINPATRIGKGVFIDHGTGIVVGETAVIGDDVSMLQGVTLGAGAKVLGNITIGDYARIASGAVVLKPVPSGCTAVGVPARLVNCPTCQEPARSMDHTLADDVYDYVI
jgi:serine O-acetyltransferase